MKNNFDNPEPQQEEIKDTVKQSPEDMASEAKADLNEQVQAEVEDLEEKVKQKMQEKAEEQERQKVLAEKLKNDFGFESVGDFVDGVAKVSKGDKQFFVNEEGENILGEEFKLVLGDFTEEDLVPVVDSEDQIKIINKEGKVIAEIPEGDGVFREGTNEGKTIVMEKSIDNDTYFLDEEGETPGRKFDEALGSYYESIDGKKINNVSYIAPFNSGFAKFETKRGKEGIMNAKGEVLAFDDNIINLRNNGDGSITYNIGRKGGKIEEMTIDNEGNTIETVD